MTPYRYSVFKDGHKQFDIYSEDYSHYSVRLPDFEEYIKTGGGGPSTDFSRDQVLCMLLAYDPKVCFDFMKVMYEANNIPMEKLRNNPLFYGFWEE